MNHAPLYAAALIAAMVAIPTAAHAGDVAASGAAHYGYNCETETMWTDDIPAGVRLYYPALDYEVVGYCGHPPTIIWTEEQVAAGAIASLTRPIPGTEMAAPPVAVTPEPVYDEPAVVAAPVPATAVSEPSPVVKPAPVHLSYPTKGYGRP